MNKYVSLLPGMAITNIRKNGSIYFPYIGVSIFAVFTYFVFDLILKNDFMYTLPKAAYTLMLVQMGFALLGIIMIPFLYYTNSFLIKRRKRELGLYSILGLEKKHIGIMMFWESAAVYVVVITAAVILGLVFSRLVFLLLLNLAKLPVNVEFAISPRAVLDTLIFYGFITVLNLCVNLIQVGKSNPVELMTESKQGEKEPKRIGLWAAVGLLALVSGYAMALKARLDSGIFLSFFLAVFLVIVGSYFLFTSGSIALLRFLKNRKKYYYTPENFITVSGMLYRMKKSAASLSNICIFSTMVMITVICTVVVYLDMDTIVRSNFNRDFEIYFYGQGQADVEVLDEKASVLAAEHGVTLEDRLTYSYVKIKIYQSENQFLKEGKPYDYSGWKDVTMMTKDEYELLEGKKTELPGGKVLLFSEGPDYLYEKVCFDDLEYEVMEELYECRSHRKVPSSTFNNEYVIVFADREELHRVAAVYGRNGYEEISSLYAFNAVGTEEDIDDFSAALERQAQPMGEFAAYRDWRENMKNQEVMYGGLLFIGIFFGSIFLICLLIIMYYKQITEGFEDQKNFEIMQKVGMDEGEIRRTVKKQISLVFALPLLGALVHTGVGMHMVLMLLGAIGFFETMLLVGCTIGCCIVFTLIYGLSYRRTSMAYYRIVKSMN